MTSREVWVPPERLDRWVANFADRHGEPQITSGEDSVTVTAANGSTAVLHAPWPPVDLSRLPVACLRRHAAKSRTILVISVRRGGFGAAIVADGKVLRSKHGTKYVQSKTAAGGWSQQRYARRRANQATALVGAALDGVQRVLVATESAPASATLDGVAVAGDKLLIDQLLEDLAEVAPTVAALPRSGHVVVGNPRMLTTQQLAEKVRSIRIQVTNRDE